MRSTENPKSPEPETSTSTLSITHILASALAAITATFAASYFGVSGTIIGAALASVVTVVGNTLYSHSIQRTRQRVRAVVPLTTLAMMSKAVAEKTAETTAPAETTPTGHSRHLWIPWKHVAVGAVGLFVIVAAVVTGVEVIAGRPLTNVVHDRSGSGTSLFGADHRSSTTPTPTPTPSHPSTASSPTSTTPSSPRSATTSATTGAPASTAPTTGAPTATFPTPTTSPPPQGSPSATPTG
jgi:hypothetical protein